jgi:hypothetical protein
VFVMIASFFGRLYKIAPGVLNALVIVKPDTVSAKEDDAPLDGIRGHKRSEERTDTEGGQSYLILLLLASILSKNIPFVRTN